MGFSGRPARIALLACMVSWLAGCDYLPFGFTPVAEVLRQSAAFEGREVKLRGTVVDVNKIPFLGIEIYTLRDDTAAILVTRPAELPRLGETLAVRGRVENLMVLGGEGLGTTLRETGRLPVLPALSPLQP